MNYFKPAIDSCSSAISSSSQNTWNLQRSSFLMKLQGLVPQLYAKPLHNLTQPHRYFVILTSITTITTIVILLTFLILLTFATLNFWEASYLCLPRKKYQVACNTVRCCTSIICDHYLTKLTEILATLICSFKS